MGTKATIITSHTAVNARHTWLADPTIAEAILDPIVHQPHRVKLKGPSLRGSKRSDA